jgi:DAK2 domain fusion protein YloV
VEAESRVVSILYVDGKRVRRGILASFKWLMAKQELLNKLNVYPVPDGDTGTNMVLTLKSAVDSIENTEGELAELGKSLSQGALLGARGNSGVILSQIVRGFADGLAGKKRVDAKELAGSFGRAVERAYSAIANPVEGTILTVLRESAQAAAATAESDPDIIHYLERLHDEAVRSLERTPEQLPALKEAGVVDSGAMGFVCIVEGILRLIRGEDLEIEITPEMLSAAAPEVRETYAGPRFCTEFVLHCGDECQDAMRSFLEGKGESLVVVGAEDLVRVHIHSDEPAEILAFARTLGEVSREKVDDMLSQHQHLYTPVDAGTAESHGPELEVGLICTAPGPGFARVFRSLGASGILMAGDTSNPSVQEILKAAEGVRAKSLIFLPNNKNIILAGEQAAAASDRPMTVVKTRTVIQGVAAAVAFSADASVEDSVEEMTAAMSDVKTVAVTKSVRDTTLDGVAIKAGDYFSLVDGSAVSAGPELEPVALDAVRAACEGCDVMSMYYGEGVSEADAAELGKRIAAEMPDLEVEIHDGGQPHYPYFISLE